MLDPSDPAAQTARTAPAGEFPRPMVGPGAVQPAERDPEAGRVERRETFLMLLLRALSVLHV
jgi:hypothetical protein